MLAQSATAAFLFGAGDIIAQQAIEHEGKNHDVRYPTHDLNGPYIEITNLRSSCGLPDWPFMEVPGLCQ